MRLKKINELENGNLLFVYWANNTGRGTNNCTLIVVPPGEQRTSYSRDVKNIISKTLTSSWRGDVNLSQVILDELGITKDNIL